MVILLQISKLTFEKNENLEKKLLISQNLPKIVRENCLFFKLSWRKWLFKILKKIQKNCITKP